MSDLLNVSSSPHVRSMRTTGNIMHDVAIALIPASVFGIWRFGIRAVLILAVTVLSCVGSEYVYESLMKKKITVRDGSALVTGLILALNMPADVPLWMPFLGGVFAIIIVKQLFGGIGQNFMNPALAARCFLLISFAKEMTEFTVDAVSAVTPLAQMKAGQPVDLAAMFVGNIPGCIGETSVIAILLGAAYMLIRKVISIRIPLTYLAVFAVYMLIFGGHGWDLSYVAAQLCGGGLMFGAFFMATDYVTSPITKSGQVIFAVILGILTGIFRTLGASAEGVSYAIIITNLFVPLIEKATLPKSFGKEAVKRG